MRLILLVLLLIAAPAWATGQFQTVESIRAAALSTVGPDADAEATLDPGLRMPACPVALQAQPTGQSTVEVACPQASGWRLFVPVKVRRNQDVLVLNRGLAAGEIIALADITIEKRDASRIAGAVLADPGEAVGKAARRVLPAGTMLSAGVLVSQRLVRRGDMVSLVARYGGVEVRMSGRALADAGQDERVAVENSSSRKVIQGIVQASGAVLVTR
ncbi:flagellar basal body P-ring formation chaperone FlgA [Pseudoxanthomonas sp.]|uniref:flagellar basal body P-ring formation chaperone FlgA n=1 Tax=Pseudoxanthomonas sp. TaxID=1871049 RepID=UPI00262524C1|nr:flagellar basal body P-ring formation chaperone FlgA [Pseudoxanthomonas sp.]WDS36858.1 MAG: flagellar basal body P-ring formation chaperone FlgA [Pseudoxanthomonas sp.]